MRTHWLLIALVAAALARHQTAEADNPRDGKDAKDGKDGKDGKAGEAGEESCEQEYGYHPRKTSATITIKTTRPLPEEFKKKKKSGRSTSSSSGETKKSDSDNEESLSINEDSSSDDDSNASEGNKKYHPVSTEERHGWRKWHRKCTPCKERSTKWRDPTVQWICGAYQRARRSFKSLCMMYLRNCQDGTMFVKIHNNRCDNDTKYNPRPFGEHFMYDYKALLSGETSDDKDDTDDSSDSISTQSEDIYQIYKN